MITDIIVENRYSPGLNLYLKCTYIILNYKIGLVSNFKDYDNKLLETIKKKVDLNLSVKDFFRKSINVVNEFNSNNTDEKHLNEITFCIPMSMYPTKMGFSKCFVKNLVNTRSIFILPHYLIFGELVIPSNVKYYYGIDFDICLLINKFLESLNNQFLSAKDYLEFCNSKNEIELVRFIYFLADYLKRSQNALIS